ncbi:hypothetical protein SL37_00296 [Klebsiella pneumoniae]|nr:hypothetical protein SL37_00296 [Klebsiella pneumoniae]KMB77422.1 hypothetical protein SL64_03660 [Klebsiella pneumoniae]CAF2788352.1 hypothetical protein AI2925V1_3958 [Klebsiella pneumoniae]CAH5421808.1 hypothetical protein AI2925V1_3958 [Klebsiella pneumoniae]
MPDGGCALPGLQPQITAGAGAAETAGAGGLNIAETFPEGRGSPHGCGLRAVFCRDAASARPEACRDKSKGPRSGDVAGRSPGVQGAAATGRPLCAPSAMSDIAQKKYWERNLSGNNIETVALLSAARAGTFPVAPLFCRVAAGTLPGLPGPLTGSHLVGPVSAAPPGDAIRHGAALLPGGGCALPGLLVRLRLSVGPVSAAPPGDGIRHGAAFMPGGGCALPGLLVRLRLSVGPASIYPLRYSSRQLSTGQPYPAPAACSCGQGLTSRTRSACRHSGRSLMESV